MVVSLESLHAGELFHVLTSIVRQSSLPLYSVCTNKIFKFTFDLEELTCLVLNFKVGQKEAEAFEIPPHLQLVLKGLGILFLMNEVSLYWAAPPLTII